MSPKAIFLSLVMCLSLTAYALADDDLFSAEFGVCMDNSGGVTSAMIECMGAEAVKQDAALNAAYQGLMARLPEDRAAALREAQGPGLSFATPTPPICTTPTAAAPRVWRPTTGI